MNWIMQQKNSANMLGTVSPNFLLTNAQANNRPGHT